MGRGASVRSPVVLARLRGIDEGRRWALAGTVLAVVVAVPMVGAGPGNDLDVANVFRSGRSIARHLSYVPSRAPGSPVHEALVGVLDLIGGPLLTNLASVAAGVAVIVLLDRLLRREGLAPGARWAVAIVAANPWFLIAATGTTDYLFALAFLLASVLALRGVNPANVVPEPHPTNDSGQRFAGARPVAAGVLAALAMGCRIGTATLVAAGLVAQLVGDRPPAGTRSTGPAAGADPATGRRATVLAGAVAAVVTVLLFVPSLVAAGGLAFAENDFSTSSPLVQLGRAAIKDVVLLGTVGSLVALLAVPALVAALRRWRASWLVRFAALGLVLSQLLFVRFPWKVPHLLPCLLCGAILLAVALADRPRLLAALAVLQLLSGVVRLDLVQPDNPNEATGGRVAVSIGWGPLVTDARCRHEHPGAYLGRQKVEVEQAWDCAKPFGG